MRGRLAVGWVVGVGPSRPPPAQADAYARNLAPPARPSRYAVAYGEPCRRGQNQRFRGVTSREVVYE
ncbi:hypothetical protein GCM10009679_73850 [Saccharothrix algeriensis]